MPDPLDRNNIERFRTLVARRLGLHFDESQTHRLAEVMMRRMAETGITQADLYMRQRLADGSDQPELRALAERLTVGETYFFRNNGHFRALMEAVLPAFGTVAGRRRLHILSAGCATGEEAYSIAMLLRDNVPDLASWDVRILGIDINPTVIERGRRAQYTTWALRETSAATQERHFRPHGKDFVLNEGIRSMVSFSERNLLDDDASFWQSGAFDVVFCRNVTMYFATQTTQKVISRIARSLVPGGHLFLGHAETLRGISHDFHLCHTHETFYYRRRNESPAESYEAGADSMERLTLPVAAYVPPLSDTSWVDAIQRASDRIESLASVPASSVAMPAVAGPGLNDALQLLKEERYTEALTSIESLPPQAQGDADAQLLQAVLLTNAGRLDEAEKLCNALLHADDLNAGAQYVMALCREHAGDHAKAAEHSQAAVYIDPGFAMAHFRLGLLAKRNGDLGSARRELAEALALLPREDASRILLFGGGFSRTTLVDLCRNELKSCGEWP